MGFAEVNGQKLFYEDSGGEGPAVILMHGFLFDETMFDDQVRVLAPSYRCIRFDARGMGQTVWDGKAFSLWDTVSDCIALMDHLKVQKAAFVGMSQGGYALMRLATRYPERVTALVFLSTYNGLDTEDTKVAYRSMRDAWSKNGPDDLLPTYKMLFLGTDEMADQKFAYWEPRWRAVGPEAYIAASNNLTERDEITDDQVREHVTMPALVVHGNGDVGMPIALAEALYKSLPNAKRMVPIEGASHGANVTHAEPVSAAIKQFLDEELMPSSASASPASAPPAG